MGFKPESRVDAILDQLIVGQGWGMRGDSSDLRSNPPGDIDAFVDALLVIDGRDPVLATKADRRFLSALVRDWVFDREGAGARSGLPLTTSDSDGSDLGAEEDD